MNRTERARKKQAAKRQNASLLPVSEVSGPATAFALSPAPAAAPPLPPPTPEPEMVVPKSRRSSAMSAREIEYMRSMREQTKAQLESITGRMFQVLNDYEISTSVENSNKKKSTNETDEEVLQPTKVKEDLQVLIGDYRDMCSEREELLYSLQDWFEEGHIDEEMQTLTAKDRRVSISAEPEIFQQSLEQGKKTAKRLQVIKEKMTQALSQQESISQLKHEKLMLERELLVSKKILNRLSLPPPDPVSVGDNKETWKYAAAEICTMLGRVRETGMSGISEFEKKVKAMATVIEEQADDIVGLTYELDTQKAATNVAELTNRKLFDEKHLLEEELKLVRTQLYTARTTVNNPIVPTAKTSDKPAAEEEHSPTPDKDNTTVTCTCEIDMKELQKKIDDLTEENWKLKEIIQKIRAENTDLELRLAASPVKPSPAVVEEVQEDKPEPEECDLWEGDSDEKMFKAEDFLEDEISEEKMTSDSVAQLNESSDSEQEQENEVPHTDSTIRRHLTARLEKRDYQLAAERERGDKLTEALKDIKHALENTKDDNQKLREKLNKLLEDQSSLMQEDVAEKKSTKKKGTKKPTKSQLQQSTKNQNTTSLQAQHSGVAKQLKSQKQDQAKKSSQVAKSKQSMKSRPTAGAKQDQSKKPSQSTKSEQSTKSIQDKPEDSSQSRQPNVRSRQSMSKLSGTKLEQSTSQGSTNALQSSKSEPSANSELSQQTDAEPKQSKLSQQHDSKPTVSQQDAYAQTTRSQQDLPEKSTQTEQSQQLEARSNPTMPELSQRKNTEPEQSAQPEQSVQNAESTASQQHTEPEKSTVSQQTELPEQAIKATSTDPTQLTSTQTTQTEQQSEQVALEQPQHDDKPEKSTQTTEQPGKSQQDGDELMTTTNASDCQSEFNGSKKVYQAQIASSTKQSPGSSKCNDAVPDQSTGPQVQQTAATTNQQSVYKQTQMNLTGQDSTVNAQRSLKAFSQQNDTDVHQSLSDTNLSPNAVNDRTSSLMLPRANNQSVDGLIAQISSLMSTGVIEHKSSISSRKSVLLSSTSVNKQRSVTDFSRSQSPRVADVTNLTVGIADEWVWNATGAPQNQSSMQTTFLPPIIAQSDSVSELQSVDKDSAVVDLVSGLIQKVNNSDNLEDIATTDATSARYVQDEVEKLTKMVNEFVEQSTGIICKEAEVVDSAAEALISSLPEEERAAMKESTGTADDSPVEHNDENKDETLPESEKLKNKVFEFGKEAIKVIKAGAMALSDQMGKRQQNLQKVVNAMTKHKAQQAKTFSFGMPESVQQMASQRANDSTNQYSYEQPLYQPNFLQPRNRNAQSGSPMIMPTHETQRFTAPNSVWGPQSTNQWQSLHTSERGDWAQSIPDPRRYYYQQPGGDEPLGISGQKTTWSHAVTSSTDPRSHMYNNQPGRNQPMRIMPGKREWTQVVTNPRRYNQQPAQDYQTGRGKHHPVGILGRQKWSSQQGNSRFNELGTSPYHTRQRPKMNKPFHYGAQNRLGNTMQLMAGNPLAAGCGTRGIGKSRTSGSKKPSKPNNPPPFAGIQAHTIGGQHRGQRRGT